MPVRKQFPARIPTDAAFRRRCDALLERLLAEALQSMAAGFHPVSLMLAHLMVVKRVLAKVEDPRQRRAILAFLIERLDADQIERLADEEFSGGAAAGQA